jgi:hypothetical protein
MQHRVLSPSLILIFLVFRILLISLVLLVLPAIALAQSVPMRITGVLLDPEDDPGEFYPYIEVSLDGELWKLRVRDVEVRSAGNSDPAILRHLGRFMILNGPTTVMDYLQSDEAEGLPLHFDGRLYFKKRVFMLSAVSPVQVDTSTHPAPQKECIGVCSDPPVQQW